MEDQYGLQRTSRPNLRGTKLLLIEDDPQQCQLIDMVLKSCMPDVNLVVAATSEQALGQLSECTQALAAIPRLILLDLYLPTREAGLHLLRSLKGANSPYRLIPLTLLSHSEKSDDIQTCYNLGANSYIIKPVSYPQWLTYFESLRQYWWHTVSLPIR